MRQEWYRIEEAPTDVLWSPERSRENRTDITGTVIKCPSGGRIVSSSAMGYRISLASVAETAEDQTMRAIKDVLVSIALITFFTLIGFIALPIILTVLSP